MGKKPGNPNFMVSLTPHGVYVKEMQFFIEQGGDTAPWGRTWLPLEAKSIEEARWVGKKVIELYPLITRDLGFPERMQLLKMALEQLAVSEKLNKNGYCPHCHRLERDLRELKQKLAELSR